MYKLVDRKGDRRKRHRRIRQKMAGTTEAPRLCVYKSLNNIYVQIIDDSCGKTLAAASTLDKDLADFRGKTNREAAAQVGKKIAAAAQAIDIKTVVFDRNGYKYHGCVSTLADAAREGGLDF